MTATPLDPLAERIVAYLTRHQREGAVWTADIAYGLKEKTPAVRTALLRLERARAVHRVVIGTPTSWALGDAGAGRGA